jgi:hypothetical protein
MPDLKIVSIVDKRVIPRGDIEMTIGVTQANGSEPFLDGPTFISSSDKVIQDVVKGILTLRGTNTLAPEYGTSINKLLHARKVSGISAQLNGEMNTLLGYLSEFNADQPLDEQIVSLVSMKAQESHDTIELDLVLQTGAGQTVGVAIG